MPGLEEESTSYASQYLSDEFGLLRFSVRIMRDSLGHCVHGVGGRLFACWAAMPFYGSYKQNAVHLSYSTLVGHCCGKIRRYRTPCEAKRFPQLEEIRCHCVSSLAYSVMRFTYSALVGPRQRWRASVAWRLTDRDHLRPCLHFWIRLCSAANYHCRLQQSFLCFAKAHQRNRKANNAFCVRFQATKAQTQGETSNSDLCINDRVLYHWMVSVLSYSFVLWLGWRANGR